MSYSRRLLSALPLVALLGLPGWLGAAERAPVRLQPLAATSASATSPARVIVKFKSGATLLRANALAAGGKAPAGPQAATTLGKRLGLGLLDGRSMNERTQLLRGTGISSQALAQRLRADSDVEWAVVDERRFALAAPDDPLYAAGQPSPGPTAGQWYLRPPSGAVKSSIDAETAWNTATGTGIVIAVLDTGVRGSHPDLAGQLLPGYDFIDDEPTANDGNGRDADPSDPGDWVDAADISSGNFNGCELSDSSSWHGTQIAGLAAAATGNATGMAGIARDAKILPVRVLGKCGGYDSDIIAAMRWAAGIHVDGVPDNTNPARVINMSLGSSGICSAAYQEVVSELTAAGKIVVAAAGNDGEAVGVPANCSGVIAVAGVRHSGTKIDSSSVGPQVTISAPGGNCSSNFGECDYALLTTVDTGEEGPGGPSYTDGFNASVGTSFSSPMVAGTVALMLSANPALTTAQVTAALKNTARAFPTTGSSAGTAVCRAPSSIAQERECYCTTSTCGAGMLNAAAAVAAASLQASSTATPASPAAGTAVTLSAAGSTVAPGHSITAYLWEITAGSSLASFSSATNAVTATLATSGAGSVTVQLTITDNTGLQSSSSQTLTLTTPVTPPASGGGGGGALTALWAAGLLLALLAAWRRPRHRAARVTGP